MKRLLLLFALVAAASPALAQRSGTSIISGVVKNADGKPIARALVQLQESSGKVPHAAHTDAEGRFRFSHLPRGIYDVRASASGYSEQWKRNNTLHEGHIITLTFALSPAPAPAKKPAEKRIELSLRSVH